MAKTFKILSGNTKLEVPQLATFTHYLNNVQFRFVVTKIPGDVAAVTHRASGKRVCAIPDMTMLAALGDAAAAGKRALDALVAQKGGLVYAALCQAEKA